MQHRQHGFTLIELFAVVLIIAVIAGVLLPALARSREEARRAICKSHLKNFGLASNMYSNDYDECYPTLGWNVAAGSERSLASLSLLFDQYISAKTIFDCPSTSDDASALTVSTTLVPEMCSYGYDSQKQPFTHPDVPIAADRSPSADGAERNSPNHGGSGQNVLYYNGYVRWQATPDCGLEGDNIWHRRGSGVLSVSDSYVVQN